jgi:hypothetical protein
MSTQVVLDPLAAKLTALLLEEFQNNTSRIDWDGEGVEVSFNQFSLTSKMKAEVNEQGRLHGCHTCPSHLEIDSDQPWVGDHFPPTELKPHARKALDQLFGTNYVNVNQQVLRPQCNDCSNRQAALVRLLNTMTGTEIVDWLKKDEDELLSVLCLIQGATPPAIGKNCIQASGPKVSSIEGKLIQDLGIRDGCHSDPTHNVPATTYHADHIWPQELCTSYMDAVLKHLKLIQHKPAKQELRPQCPRCSGNQGGKLKQIATLAQDYATQNNITFYK